MGDGGAAAVRDGGMAVLTRPDVRRFAVELWMRRRGLDEAAPAFDCRKYVCRPVKPLPVTLIQGFARKAPPADVIDEACREAEVVVLRGTPQGPAPACRNRLLLTEADFVRGGGLEAWRRPSGGWRLLWTQDVRGRRPWTAASDSESSDTGG